MKRWLALTMLVIFALPGCAIVGDSGKNLMTDSDSFTTLEMPLENSTNFVQSAPESISVPAVSHEQVNAHARLLLWRLH